MTYTVHRPLRVLHLIKSLGRGGAEVLLSEGLKYADRERFTYGYGYFLQGKDAVVPDLERQGADVVCFDAAHTPGVLLAVPRVARFLKRWQADLVHCHLPVSGVASRLAGQIAGVPVVYTEHIDMEQYHPLTRWANLATWGLQERVIAVSDEASASARRHAGDRVPIQVVLNGVDTAAFAPSEEGGQDVRARYGIDAEAPVIGTVAVFRKQKRLQDWLLAARRIHEQRPDARFLLVGEGPEREDVEALADELSLRGVLHFAGFQEEVRPFLSAMDVYMMSSEREGLPIALLEAMSSALPIVSTAVGGIPRTVEEGRSGRLVAVGDVASLAEATAELLDDAELRHAMGQQARHTIEARFSMKRMMRDLEAMYLDVLQP